jgi:hypothetical protein
MMQKMGAQRQPGAVFAWVVAMCAVAIAIAALAWSLAVSRNAQEREADAMALVLARLEAIERERPATGNGFHRPVATAPPAFSSPISPGGNDGQLTPAQAEAQSRAQLRHFEASFAQQPRDPGAPRVEVDMLAAMADEALSGAGVVPANPDVDCRRDICRIVADFPSRGDAVDWSALYLTLLGREYIGSAQPVFMSNADGSTRMQLFANRGSSTGPNGR